MEKKSSDSISKSEKRAQISSSGDLVEFDEHISISGSGKISGGKINKSIRVSGSGRINGDFECNGLTSSGSLKASGNLTAHGDISSSGTFSIAGFLYGDEEAEFSGSTQVGNVIKVQGSLTASGSFKAGHFVTSDKVIKISGSSNINGNLSAEENIIINGSTNIEGNVVASDVLFGGSGAFKLKKQHYRVQGRIHAKNIIEIIKTHVGGDVRGKVIRIGEGTEILGNVYYADIIEVDKKAKLAHEPIKIGLDEL